MKLTASFDDDEIRRRTEAAEKAIRDDAQNTMQVIGVQVLSLAKIDYDVKGRGGTGSDGLSWDKIKRSTAEAIARRSSKVRRLVEQRRKLADDIKKLRAPGPSKPKRQPKSARVKAVKDAFAARKNANKIKLLQVKRANLLQKINAEIDRIWNSHQTGIDSGLQRSSASPGFTAAGGGNVLIATPQSVTVGFGRSYSGYFDEKRKLMPATLPAQWEKDLNAIIERRADKIMREHLEAE